jgi:CRP/FNR family transcriptional regulator
MRLIPSTQKEKLDFLHSCQYFQGLDDATYAILASGTTKTFYKRGEPLFWQGDPCSGLFSLKEGRVKLFRISPGGRELIIQVFDQGQIFNEVPVFDDGPNPVNVSALLDSEAWVVSRNVVQEAMLRNPTLMKHVIGQLSQHIRMMVKRVEELSFYAVTNRLARLIDRASPQELRGSSGIRMTQDEMAARLGTVREVVARSIKQLEKSGAIETHRGLIWISDEELLRDWTS